MTIEVQSIHEPARLILTWRSHMQGTSSKYFPVAELIRAGRKVVFKYLSDTEEYHEAKRNGFLGFPGVSETTGINENALDLFVRRLPPDTREDYHLYLKQNRLPANFSGSIFSLLAYTGGRLASDPFVLIPDIANVTSPADLLLDIHGLAYYLARDEIKKVTEGSGLTFCHELDNEHDADAVAIYLDEHQLGYVSRVISTDFLRLINTYQVKGMVAKTIVTPYTNRIVILVSIR